MCWNKRNEKKKYFSYIASKIPIFFLFFLNICLFVLIFKRKMLFKVKLLETHRILSVTKICLMPDICRKILLFILGNIKRLGKSSILKFPTFLLIKKLVFYSTFSILFSEDKAAVNFCTCLIFKCEIS